MNNKEKIINSANKLFEEKGYFNTNSNEIAKSAGLAAGTFYNYFKTKEELFIEIYTRWHVNQRMEIQQVTFQGYEDKVFTKKCVDIIIKYYSQSKNFRSAIHVLKNSSENVYEFRLTQRKILIETIENVLKIRSTIRSKEEVILFQLGLERFFDAYVHGELGEVGISKKRQKLVLYNYFHEFAAGEKYV